MSWLLKGNTLATWVFFDKSEGQAQSLMITKSSIVSSWGYKISVYVYRSSICVGGSWLWYSKSESMISPFDKTHGVGIDSRIWSGVKFLGT